MKNIKFDLQLDEDYNQKLEANPLCEDPQPLVEIVKSPEEPSKIKDISTDLTGHRQRLKERFIKAPSALPDYELVELILFNAIPRRDVKKLAKSLLNKFGSISRLLDLDPAKAKESGLELSDNILLQFALLKEVTARSLKEDLSEKPILSNMNSLYDYLRSTMGNKNIENFRVLYLNTKNYLIADESQDYGTIDQTHVYPREILKRAIFHDAAAIIIAHNHPSGVAKPSKSDIILTQKILEACKTIDVSLHDHIIVSSKEIFSFRSNNLL